MNIKLLTAYSMVRDMGRPKIDDLIYKGRPETNVEKIVGPEAAKLGAKQEYLRIQLEKLLNQDTELVRAALDAMSPEDADLLNKNKEELAAIAEKYSWLAKQNEAQIREGNKPEPSVPGQRLSREEARAALQAMKEPTESSPRPEPQLHRLSPAEARRAALEATAMPMPEAPLGSPENPWPMPEAPEEPSLEVEESQEDAIRKAEEEMAATLKEELKKRGKAA